MLTRKGRTSTSVVVSWVMVSCIMVVSLCVFRSFNAALLQRRSLSRRGHFVLQSVSQKVTQSKTPHAGRRAEWPALPERSTPRTGLSTPVAPALARRQGEVYERAVLVRRLGAP